MPHPTPVEDPHHSLRRWIEMHKEAAEALRTMAREEGIPQGHLLRAAQHLERCLAALHDALDALSAGDTGRGVDKTTPSTQVEGDNRGYRFHPIGWVENEFDEPARSELLRKARSRIVLQPEYAHGLTGMEPDSRLLVIFDFHLSSDYDLLQHPRGDRSRELRGVFTLRSPNRPNPIGVTEVALLSIEDHVLTVQGLDAIDGTPVLDLKPA